MEHCTALEDRANTCLGHPARSAQKVVFLCASLQLSNCFVRVCHLLLHEVRQAEQPLRRLLFLNLPCAKLNGLIGCLNCSICEMEISAMFLHNFLGDVAMKSVTRELLFLFRHRLGSESVSSLLPGFKPPESTTKKSSPSKTNIYKLLCWLICALKDFSRLYPCRILKVYLAQGKSSAYSKQGMCTFPAVLGCMGRCIWLKPYTTYTSC